MLLLALGLAGSAFAGDGPLGLSMDELWDALVPDQTAYRPVFSEPMWVVPSGALPAVELGQSNNNLSIALHDGRLYLAWRTAPTHFASARARLYVVSSADMGGSWTLETTISLGRDVREPFLLSAGGRLWLHFVELGDNPLAFEPRALWRIERRGPGLWTSPERWGENEVAWDFKVRRGRAWVSSYGGKHYGVGPGIVTTHFRSSTDGVRWEDAAGSAAGETYHGGVSETSFEFDRTGRLWAVTRNEDGDASGFGSHVVTAPSDRPGAWEFPARSHPERYDSPRLFRHGSDIYLIARRDLAPTAIGTTWARMPDLVRKLFIWQTYWFRPKRTALYRLDPVQRRLVPLVDLPSAGDTAFPSIVRLGPDDYLVANYTSPLSEGNESWLGGQVRETRIYFVLLRFEPVSARPTSAALASALAASRAR